MRFSNFFVVRDSFDIAFSVYNFMYAALKENKKLFKSVFPSEVFFTKESGVIKSKIELCTTTIRFVPFVPYGQYSDEAYKEYESSLNEILDALDKVINTLSNCSCQKCEHGVEVTINDGV